MKKLVSFMLALLMIMPCVGMIASAKEVESGNKQTFGDVQGFIDDALELTDNTSIVQDVPVADNGGIGNEGDTNENFDFETCRLVVESEEKPDKLNSLGIASGFMNYHIVQFANAKDTEKAFEYYSAQEEVVSVFVDQVLDLPEPEIKTGDLAFNELRKAPERLGSWGADFTGFYELKDYLMKNNVSMDKVVVGVVDTGIDLDHEFF